MTTVAIQRGHCFRTRGATGTSGHRGTEQEFANRLAQTCRTVMEARGHRVYVLLADEAVPKADVFMAFHQDGSSNSNASGASVGYQTDRSRRYAQTWKACYEAAGWPGGFRADNYTAALRGYYGFRRADSPVEIIFEHGFATNRAEENWMWDHFHQIAVAHADALDLYLGNAPPPEGNIMAQLDRIEAHLKGRDPGDGSEPHRRFVHDQHKHTRGDIAKEGERTRVGTLSAILASEGRIVERIDALESTIRDLAGGGPDGPVNVSDADAAKVARAVVQLLDDHPLAPQPPI